MSKHRKMVEKYIGIKLPKGSHVHHINCNHDDNCLKNFYVFLKGKDHAKFHQLVNAGHLTYDVLTSNLDTIKDEIDQSYSITFEDFLRGQAKKLGYLVKPKRKESFWDKRYPWAKFNKSR